MRQLGELLRKPYHIAFCRSYQDQPIHFGPWCPVLFASPLPLSVNFWDHHRARFLGKKSTIIAGDDRVSVRLSYDANFKWHMPICVEDTVLNKNICHFLGSSPSALSGKNPNHRNICQWCNAALGIFFCETRLVTVPRSGFFPGFMDKG